MKIAWFPPPKAKSPANYQRLCHPSVSASKLVGMSCSGKSRYPTAEGEAHNNKHDIPKKVQLLFRKIPKACQNKLLAFQQSPFLSSIKYNEVHHLFCWAKASKKAPYSKFSYEWLSSEGGKTSNFICSYSLNLEYILSPAISIMRIHLIIEGKIKIGEVEAFWRSIELLLINNFNVN